MRSGLLGKRARAERPILHFNPPDGFSYLQLRIFLTLKFSRKKSTRPTEFFRVVTLSQMIPSITKKKFQKRRKNFLPIFEDQIFGTLTVGLKCDSTQFHPLGGLNP